MAALEDAGAIADIYLPYVRDTVISFETAPPSVAEMRTRVKSTLVRLPWLVITDRDVVKGYAYASPYGVRDAYSWSAEVSVYLASPLHRGGHGRRLYTALLNLLSAQGYINAYAAIALPNPASVGLHEAMGFGRIGVFAGVGFKNGAWWDVGWWHRRLAEPALQPRKPRPWSDLPKGAVDSALGSHG